MYMMYHRPCTPPHHLCAPPPPCGPPPLTPRSTAARHGTAWHGMVVQRGWTLSTDSPLMLTQLPIDVELALSLMLS